MHLTSINLGQKQQLQIGGKMETTGIFKSAVAGPVMITRLGLEHDFIASKKHHGGPDQAVYLYGADDYEWWSRELGREMEPGTFGENLTVAGLESARFHIGDLLRAGHVLMQVTAPRIPCGTFATRMQDPGFVKRFRSAERPGLYCRVLQEGAVQAGDEVSFEPFQGRTVSILEVYREYYNKEKSLETIRQFLDAPVAERLRAGLERELSAKQES